MYDLTTIGTCSICDGEVQVPNIWMGVIPPQPTCNRCGAVEANNGPVIPMSNPVRKSDEWKTTDGTGINHLKYNSYSTS